MRYLMGLTLAGGLLAGMSSESRAQFALSVGNPYIGQGVAVGAPGFAYSSGYSGINGYGYGAPGYYGASNFYGTTGYLAGPGAYGYGSGYRGYGYRPYYGSYGYGNYGYGARGGFRPFRGVGRVFR